MTPNLEALEKAVEIYRRNLRYLSGSERKPAMLMRCDDADSLITTIRTLQEEVEVLRRALDFANADYDEAMDESEETDMVSEWIAAARLELSKPKEKE